MLRFEILNSLLRRFLSQFIGIYETSSSLKSFWMIQGHQRSLHQNGAPSVWALRRIYVSELIHLKFLKRMTFWFFFELNAHSKIHFKNFKCISRIYGPSLTISNCHLTISNCRQKPHFRVVHFFFLECISLSDKWQPCEDCWMWNREFGKKFDNRTIW